MRTSTAPSGPGSERSSKLATGSGSPMSGRNCMIISRAWATVIASKGGASASPATIAAQSGSSAISSPPRSVRSADRACPALPVGIAQLALEDLPDGAARQLVDELDRFRRLERSDRRLAVRDQGVGVGHRVGAQLD